jgi:hypothetical protein
LEIKTKIVSCHVADSKPVKQEVYSTVILPPLIFPVLTQIVLYWQSSLCFLFLLESFYLKENIYSTNLKRSMLDQREAGVLSSDINSSSVKVSISSTRFRECSENTNSLLFDLACRIFHWIRLLGIVTFVQSDICTNDICSK